MSKKKKNIPLPEPEQSELEYTLPSASMSDMTGLIPANAADENNRDSYSDIIPYMADSTSKHHSEKRR